MGHFGGMEIIMFILNYSLNAVRLVAALKSILYLVARIDYVAIALVACREVVV